MNYSRQLRSGVGWVDLFAKPITREAMGFAALNPSYGSTTALLRRLRHLAEHARRHRKAARRAVGHLDLIFPGQPEGAGHHVLHEGVGTIHRAALHRDIAAVPELVDVVLDAPVNPRLAHQIRAYLRGDDLVGPSRGAVGDDAAVEIHDHAFAHRIERTIRSAHADIRGYHEILERVGLVGEAPAVADRRGVAGGADHDLRALVGTLPRHLREHAVMADDQRDLCTFWSLDHGNADVARFPRFDRNPRVEFSIIQFDLAVIVDDQAGIVGIAVGVELHDGKAAPDFMVDASSLERRDFRAVEPAHDFGIGVHRQAVQRIFGEHHEVHGAEIAPRLADHVDDALGLARQVRLGHDDGQLQLNEPDDDAIRRFVEAAKSVHIKLLLTCDKELD